MFCFCEGFGALISSCHRVVSLTGTLVELDVVLTFDAKDCSVGFAYG